MVTRRTFLAGLAASTVACRVGDTAPDPDPHARAVRAAIDRAGGLGFVQRGQRVLLKVNTNSGDVFPYSTSPTTVKLIASTLIAAGAKVTVGDRSFWGDDDTAGNFEDNGIAAATRAAGATLAVFDDSIEWVEIDPDLVPHWKPPFRLPRLAVEADHVINLACLKTHFISGVTLGLKNWLGLVHASDRARPGNLRSHDAKLIHHQIADVHRALAPRLTVIDGYRALIAGGPTRRDGSPATADLRIVLAGRDRIALEIEAIAQLQKYAVKGEAIHRTKPDQHPTVVAARAAKLG